MGFFKIFGTKWDRDKPICFCRRRGNGIELNHKMSTQWDRKNVKNMVSYHLQV